MDETNLKEKLCNFYEQRIINSDITYHTVWGDTAEWKAFERFKIVESTDFAKDDKLLDLGCGNGLLYKHLLNNNVDINYVGVDVVPAFLEHINKTYKLVGINLDFFNNVDILPEADWYAIFGSINKKWMVGLNDNESEHKVYDWIKQIFNKANKGVYLNCFSARTNCPKSNNVHLDPIRIVIEAGDDMRFYRIRHDLEFFEFSMMMRK